MTFGDIGIYSTRSPTLDVPMAAPTQPTAQPGAVPPRGMPPKPETLKADLDKLDQHLPKADPNKPYTTEDVANALRDPETGKPVHANGKPVSEQELQALTELSNHPAKREGFFAVYEKQYAAAASELDQQKRDKTIDALVKGFQDLLKGVAPAITAHAKEEREREQIDNIVPKMQARLANRPMAS